MEVQQFEPVPVSLHPPDSPPHLWTDGQIHKRSENCPQPNHIMVKENNIQGADFRCVFHCECEFITHNVYLENLSDTVVYVHTSVLGDGGGRTLFVRLLRGPPHLLLLPLSLLLH